MTESAAQPTHRPKPDAELEPRGYLLGVGFHPSIVLGKGGYNFAASISDYLEARTITLEQDRWTFLQSFGQSQMQFLVTPTTAQFEISFPNQRLDWIASRCEMIFDVFRETFKPNMVLNSVAKVVGTMQIDGDAREFLVRHVTKFEPKRFSLLKRPIHAFGIRVFCPPFQKVVKKGKKQVKEPVPWVVDVKAESLMDDPTKLYLEAEAQWPMTGVWDAPKIKEMSGRIALVQNYLKNDVMEFLQNPATGEQA